MRSRRHKLQVSTFPFLAVLLCAMGALLLVLLVMDRRAHRAAQARADQAARQAAEDAALDDESRRAALEQQREAALHQAADEHTRLEAETSRLQGETQSVRDQLAEAAERLRAERDDEAALKHKAEAANTQARAEEQALLQMRGAEETIAARSEASRRQLAEMTADLAQLERALAELKAAREKGQRTYSVVPYNGKRGENRRPVYVECAAGGVVFHPDGLAMPDTRDAEAVRGAVERRLAGQKAQLTPAQAAGYSPYLMLLVRPDGVLTYYRLREALRNLKVDFGYEFIDADWVLDFPADDAAPAPTWTTAAKPPEGPAGKSSGPALHGAPSNQSPGQRSARPGPFPGSGGDGTGAPSAGGFGMPGPGGPGVALGPPSPAGSPDVGGPPRIRAGTPPGSPLGSEFGTAGRRDGGAPGGGGGPPGAARTSALSGVSQGVNLPSALPAARAGTATPPGAGGSSAPAGAQGAAATSPPPPPGPSGKAPGPSGKAPGKGAAAGGADPDDDPFVREPPAPLPKTARTAPALRPARLSGDRDWIIYVECKPEGVVVYPTQLLVPAATLAHPSGSNPLLQSIQQLIDRKQASVRPGDAPYRPEVRFLVHPDALRTYHTAYPLLDAIAAPKTAQDIGPGDEVPAIIAGH